MGINFLDFETTVPRQNQKAQQTTEDFLFEPDPLAEFTMFEEKEPTQSEQVGEDINQGYSIGAAIMRSTARRIATQQTPEELVAEGFNTAEATLISTGQEVLAPMLSVGNALLAGLPRGAVKKMGVKDAFKTKELNIGKLDIHPNLVNLPADLLGFVRGPLKAAGAIAKPLVNTTAGAASATNSLLLNTLKAQGVKVGAAETVSKGLTSGLAQDTLSGAIQWGLASGANQPEDEFLNLEAAKTRATIGAVGGAIVGAGANRAAAIKKVMAREEQVARVLRGKIKKGFKTRGSDFEKSLYENTLEAQGPVDITNDLARLSTKQRSILEQVAKTRESKSILKTASKRTPGVTNVSSRGGVQVVETTPGRIIPSRTLTSKTTVRDGRSEVAKLLNNPDKTSARQIKSAINEVNEELSKAKLSGKGLRASDTDVKRLGDKMDDILYNKYPGMRQVDKIYGEFSEKLGVFENLNIKNTQSSIKSALNNKEVSRVLKDLVGDKFFKTLKTTYQFQATKKAGVHLLGTALKYGILYSIFVKHIHKGLKDIGLEQDLGSKFDGGGG